MKTVTKLKGLIFRAKPPCIPGVYHSRQETIKRNWTVTKQKVAAGALPISWAIPRFAAARPPCSRTVPVSRKESPSPHCVPACSPAVHLHQLPLDPGSSLRRARAQPRSRTSRHKLTYLPYIHIETGTPATEWELPKALEVCCINRGHAQPPSWLYSIPSASHSVGIRCGRRPSSVLVFSLTLRPPPSGAACPSPSHPFLPVPFHHLSIKHIHPCPD